MLKTKSLLLIVLSFFLFQYTTQIQELLITGENEFTFTDQSFSNIILLNCIGLFKNYIKVKVDRNISNKFNYHILISETNNVETGKDITFKSGTNDHVVHYPLNNPEDIQELPLYMNVLTEEGNVGSYTLKISYVDYIDLSENNFYSFFIGENIPSFNQFKAQLPKAPGDVYFHLLEPKMEYDFISKYFQIEIYIKQKNEISIIEYETITNTFHDGYSIKIPCNRVAPFPYDPNTFITLKYIPQQLNPLKI